MPKIRKWSAFKKNADTMAQLHLTLDNAIEKYADRRVQARLFYVIPDLHDFTFTVRSHLYGDSEFLRDLWQKRMIERKTNHEMCNGSLIVEESNLSDRSPPSILVATIKLCTMRHTFGLLLVTSLAFAIVYL